jgi:hypothetical protein
MSRLGSVAQRHQGVGVGVGVGEIKMLKPCSGIKPPLFYFIIRIYSSTLMEPIETRSIGSFIFIQLILWTFLKSPIFIEFVNYFLIFLLVKSCAFSVYLRNFLVAPFGIFVQLSVFMFFWKCWRLILISCVNHTEKILM